MKIPSLPSGETSLNQQKGSLIAISNPPPPPAQMVRSEFEEEARNDGGWKTGPSDGVQSGTKSSLV